MKETFSPESIHQFSEPEKEAIESLIASLERIQQNVEEDNHLPALSFLLERAKLNGLQKIVTKTKVQTSDTIPEIISKLNGALGREGEALPVLDAREVANDNPSAEQQSEQDQIQQELILLDLFAQTKVSEQEDILQTEDRVVHYEQELSALTPGKKSGFWQSILSKDQEQAAPPVDPDQEKRKELENKIMRSQTELAGRIEKTQTEELRFRNLLQSWQEHLGEPIAEVADWQQLVEKVKEAGKKILAKGGTVDNNPLGQKENSVVF